MCRVGIQISSGCEDGKCSALIKKGTLLPNADCPVVAAVLEVTITVLLEAPIADYWTPIREKMVLSNILHDPRPMRVRIIGLEESAINTIKYQISAGLAPGSDITYPTDSPPKKLRYFTPGYFDWANQKLKSQLSEINHNWLAQRLQPQLPQVE